jgi:hypothetical protein
VSKLREAGVVKSVSKTGPRSFRLELPAAATMLVVEHGRVAHSLAGWQIAVVVLRYFVAVLMLASDKTRDCAAARYRRRP